jgi:hypothetical protein
MEDNMNEPIKILFDYEDIDRLTGLVFDDRLSADSVQALMEDFRKRDVTLSELIDTIHDAILNEEVEEAI